jgi:serine/threonine-protein kinase RsbW
MTLELHATPEEVMRAVESFQDFARTQQLPEKATFGLALALEECGSNIVNYALEGVARRKFRVSFGRAGDEIFIELRDPGPEFDPTTWQSPGSGIPCGDSLGGWGIQLVRRYIDEIRYAREAGENVLRLGKRLGSEDGAKEFQNSQTKQS